MNTTHEEEIRAILEEGENYDVETNDTWYEGTMEGARVRILQEEPGSDWFIVEYKPQGGECHYLETADLEPMTFESARDAAEELAHQIECHCITF